MNRTYDPLEGDPQETRDAYAGDETREDGDEETSFPIDALPGAVSEMAKAVAEVERVPDALAGACALGILSASIGKGLQVKSGPDRYARGNLFIILTAESGSGKSESFRHLGSPFFQYELELKERWLAELKPKRDVERKVIEAEKKALERNLVELNGDSGVAQCSAEVEQARQALETTMQRLAYLEGGDAMPILATEDVTTEKLADILNQNNECVASLSADAGSAVNQVLGRYSKLDRTEESLYLRAYSGDRCAIHRKGGDSIILHSPCLSLLWFTQPDKLETLVGNDALIEGGLMPRINICHTGCEPCPIPEDQTNIPSHVRGAYDRLVRALLETYRFAGEPYTIEATDDANATLVNHYNEIVARWRDEYRDISGFAMRWTEHAWRISVCLHAAKWGADAFKYDIDLGIAENAIRSADFFRDQQLKVLSGKRLTARESREERVMRLFERSPGGITARDVQRKRIVRTAEEARDLLRSMPRLIGRDIVPDGGGRISRVYTKKPT
ncbi:MAG: DUF3987 domain-containing protein [Verrucomicrobiota bacterium]